MKKLLTLLTLLVLAGPLAAQPAAPALIPFQGRLTDQNGVAYGSGQYTIVFQLYDQAVGGTLLWAERHEKVGLVNGMVNVFLGSINANLGTNNFSTTRYLGITVDGDNNPNTADPAMFPRQLILPVIWAKKSDDSLKLAGSDWTPLFGTNSPTGRLLNSKLPTDITANTLAASGSISAPAINTSGNISAGGNVTGTFVGNGAAVTNLSLSNATTFVKGQIRKVAYDEIVGPQILTINQPFSNVPSQNEIPKITQGAQIFNVNFDPLGANNYLLVELVVVGSETADHGNAFIAALFKDDAQDAIATMTSNVSPQGQPLNGGLVMIRKKIQLTSTARVNFKVRAAVDAGSPGFQHTTLNSMRHVNNTAIPQGTLGV